MRIENRPSVPVTAEYRVPVGSCTASMLAPGNTPPLSSVTSPEMAPVVTVCAPAGEATRSANSASANANRPLLTRRFIAPLQIWNVGRPAAGESPVAKAASGCTRRTRREVRRVDGKEAKGPSAGYYFQEVKSITLTRKEEGLPVRPL